MANCSIPNFKPANGRISTISSRQLRKRNSQETASVFVISRWDSSVQRRRQGIALQSALRARRIQSAIGDRQPRRKIAETEAKAATASGERARATSEFRSAIWRVKGAWWPSRSSKPSSSRKWRGRFDSYPLRAFLQFPVAVSLCETYASPTRRRLQQPSSRKEVNRMSREQIRKLTSLSSCSG
jgi:hypothetical protein